MTSCTHALIALLLGPALMAFAHALDCNAATTQAKAPLRNSSSAVARQPMHAERSMKTARSDMCD